MNIKLKIKTPRSLDVAHLDLAEGLKVSLFIGYVFMGAAILLFLAGLLVPVFPKEVRVYICIFGAPWFFFLGWLNYGPAVKRKKVRKQVLEHGMCLEGRVIAHKNKINFYKKSFSGDQVLDILFADGDQQHRVEARGCGIYASTLHDQYPLGSAISVLYDPQSKKSFVPAEIGWEFVMEN